MFKRLYWLGLGVLAGWLAWEWLRRRQANPGVHEPQFATPPPTYPRADDDQVAPPDLPAAAYTPAADEVAPPAPLPPDAYPRADNDQVAPADLPAAVDPAQTILGYCTRCREKRPIQDAQETTSANGRRAARGACPVCGAKMFTFLESR